VVRGVGARCRRVALPRVRIHDKTHDTCLLRGEDGPGRPRPPDMRLPYPRARGVFLSRDPGDHLASVLAFFPKDRRRFEADEQFVDLIRTAYTATCTEVKAHIAIQHACPL
jgi:hypothetical protein